MFALRNERIFIHFSDNWIFFYCFCYYPRFYSSLSKGDPLTFLFKAKNHIQFRGNRRNERIAVKIEKHTLYSREIHFKCFIAQKSRDTFTNSA